MKQAVSTRALAVLAGASVLFSAHVASALLPLDVEIGAKVGGGTTPSDVASGATNPLGFGLGGRAGVAFLGLYGGVSIAYYFGGSETLPIVGAVVPAVSSSTHSLMYGFEAGYGTVLVNVLTLRAQVGIGNYTRTADIGSRSVDSSNLYLEPGIHRRSYRSPSADPARKNTATPSASRCGKPSAGDSLHGVQAGVGNLHAGNYCYTVCKPVWETCTKELLLHGVQAGVGDLREGLPLHGVQAGVGNLHQGDLLHGVQAGEETASVRCATGVQAGGLHQDDQRLLRPLGNPCLRLLRAGGAAAARLLPTLLLPVPRVGAGVQQRQIECVQVCPRDLR